MWNCRNPSQTEKLQRRTHTTVECPCLQQHTKSSTGSHRSCRKWANITGPKMAQTHSAQFEFEFIKYRSMATYPKSSLRSWPNMRNCFPASLIIEPVWKFVKMQRYASNEYDQYPTQLRRLSKRSSTHWRRAESLKRFRTVNGLHRSLQSWKKFHIICGDHKVTVNQVLEVD